MKLDPKFEILGRALDEMGVELNYHRFGGPSEIPRELKARLEGQGDDFKNLDEIQVKGGVLTYAGQQIVVYIRTAHQSEYTLRTEPLEGPKYHITWCRTLQHMKESARYYRYVRASKTDGTFTVQYRNPTGKGGLVDAELAACMNCLHETNWKGFASIHGWLKRGWQERQAARLEFNLKEFFESSASMIREIPMYSDTSMPLDDYPPNWAEISRNFRASKNWICERCEVNLTSFKAGLHTHHTGHKFDRDPTKLEALCALCHKLKHPRMYVAKDVADLIIRLRGN